MLPADRDSWAASTTNMQNTTRTLWKRQGSSAINLSCGQRHMKLRAAGRSETIAALRTHSPRVAHVVRVSYTKGLSRRRSRRQVRWRVAKAPADQLQSWVCVNQPAPRRTHTHTLTHTHTHIRPTTIVCLEHVTRKCSCWHPGHGRCRTQTRLAKIAGTQSRE